MTSQRQVNDWLKHPEKYDADSDDDFANFMAWIILIAELNPGMDANGNVIRRKSDMSDTVMPTSRQVAEKVCEIRGRRH